MNQKMYDRFEEIYNDYVELGADLYLLEAAAEKGREEVLEECLENALLRLRDYIQQHTGDIHKLSEWQVKQLTSDSAPREDPKQYGRDYR